MARFRCSASTSLNWGEGCFYFSFYSVQDYNYQGPSFRSRDTKSTTVKYRIPLFRTATGQRFFQYRAVSIWNSLDKDLKNHGVWDIQVLDSYLLIIFS